MILFTWKLIDKLLLG